MKYISVDYMNNCVIIPQEVCFDGNNTVRQHLPYTREYLTWIGWCVKRVIGLP